MQKNVFLKREKRKYLFDLLLVFALLAIALFAFGIKELLSEDGAYAVVEIDGVEIASYPLSKDAEYELPGGKNILKIEDGEAYISYASCPDHLCQKMGRISRTGESVVCLPNRTSVKIVGEGEEIIGG